MWVPFLLFSSLLLIDPSTGCCCNHYESCECNWVGCNCNTVNGWCKKGYYGPVKHGGHVSIKPLCWNPGFGLQAGCLVCYSSEGAGTGREDGKDEEYCPHRRRLKRSVATTIIQAYGEIHPDLIDRHEMENFLRFDLNRDGLVSLEEANRSNATIEEFKQVDANNEGFVHPSEFDASLI